MYISIITNITNIQMQIFCQESVAEVYVKVFPLTYVQGNSLGYIYQLLSLLYLKCKNMRNTTFSKTRGLSVDFFV